MAITASADSLLQKTVELTFAADAILSAAAANTVTVNADALLQATVSLTLVADALLRLEGIEVTTNADALLQKTATVTTSADALLRGSGPGVVPGLEAEEDVLELDHAGVREEEGGILPGDERRAADDLVPAALEVAQEFLPYLVSGHAPLLIIPPGAR